MTTYEKRERRSTTMITDTRPAATATRVPNAIRLQSEPGAARRLSRILVATDGTAASEGAMIVAGLLAHRHHAGVDVVSVLPRWGQPPPAPEFLAITGELLEERLASVIPQGKRTLGTAPRWAIRVIDSSSVVETIVETARREGHDLIITGTRRSGITRWLRSPTALAVAQRSHIPVLAVPPSVSTLPARAVVGIEGTSFDLTSAATAVGVLAEGAVVHLVHVDTTEAPLAWGTEDRAFSARVAAKFADLARVSADAGVASVKRVVLRGREPAARLVAYGEGINADLVVAGARPPTTIAERISGGVSGRVLRAADGCVLLCGPDDRTKLRTTDFKETHHALMARTQHDGVAAAAVHSH